MDGNCFWGTPRINTWSPFVQHCPCRFANYPDDNKPYATANDMDSFIVSLEETSKSLFTWFGNNLMKSNAGK